MARLPIVDGDDDTWGTVLNDYLSVSIDGDGTLSSSAVELAIGVLGGDLSGTLPDPTVAKIDGITVTGTPSTGQMLVATSPTAASWSSGGAFGPLTGDVTSIGDATTLQGTINSESFLRSQAPNQQTLMSASLNFNTQGATWMSFLDVQNGTAGDGRVRVQLNPALFAGYLNAADTQPAWAMGSTFGDGLLELGVGGTTAPDVQLFRTGTGALLKTSAFTLQDATAAHGSVAASVNPAALQLFANNTDTAAVIQLSEFFSLPGIGFGPGGSTSTDTFFLRTGTAQATIQASTLTTDDGTTGHGKVVSSLNPASSAGYLTTTDTQPYWALTQFIGASALTLGAGGTTAPDVFITRSAAGHLAIGAAVTITANANPLRLNQISSGPSGLTSNTDAVLTLYFGGTNYYLLVAFNDGGTVRYKYLELTGTGTTWATGTTLPT